MLGALAPNIGSRELPGTDQLAAEIINLPVDAGADVESIEKNAELIKRFFRPRRRTATKFLNR
jgi:hypothetical protein